MNKHILSKSTFIRGCQCVKSLYLNKHQPQLKDKTSFQQQGVFDRGTTVGELAQQLFPGGIDASPESKYDYQQSVAYTRHLMDSGQPIIYEAAFQFEGVFAAIDILVKQDGVWKGFEVKSTTSLKEPHLLDAALQYYVITKAGIALDDISIVYLNNRYVRMGELDIQQLFTVRSIVEEVKEKQDFVFNQVPRLKEVIAQAEVPVVDIGMHCVDPYPCEFASHCWQHIPKHSVFDISRMQGKRQFDLYRQGIIRFEDITVEHGLTDHQQLQVTCQLNNIDYINLMGLQKFLSSLSYPLYFLDFETINPAIPLYDHSRPYQQIPFQYSIHYKKTRDGELRHTEFLATPATDPRPAFVKELLARTHMSGTILTYHQSFEKGILLDLADAFPHSADALRERISRIRDLMPPFQQKLYYTPEMNGAYSIKEVLPALVPELNYDHLPINNGGDASLYFELMIYDLSVDHTAIRNNLLAYCKMDTLAMVRILEKLEAIV